MKYFNLMLAILFSTLAIAQQSNTKYMKTIEVTGEAKRVFTPDQISFTITIEEYWEEEFEGKKPKDYRTKVDIELIEKSLISELKLLNITMDQITLKQAGNYWRQRGKDFLVNKTIDIKLSDFVTANEIANTVKTRGVRNMNVTKMNHKDLDQIKLEVKAEAVKAAKAKAALMAGALGKKVKDVLSIIEIDQNAHLTPRPQYNAYARSASMMDESGGGVEYENFRKLETKAAVRVVFEIE